MSNIRVDLRDRGLFGNDAAEDEEDDIFGSYSLERAEASTFLDATRRICIARAWKGEGKSALLRIVQSKLAQGEGGPLVVIATGKQVSPALEGSDTDVWAREWKASILRLVAREFGSRIGMAWTDDAISLVEEAEKSGFKSRSIVSAIFDRLRSPKVPIERSRLDLPSAEQIVKRWAERSDGIWMFIDDVDENFQNNPKHKAKVASFFLAIREIANLIPAFRFRLAVRPNTWSTISHDFEGLSKVEQYCEDLRWTEADIRDLLAGRIRGYLSRTNQYQRVASQRADDLVALVFQSPMPWGGREAHRPPHVPLATLSRRRPRWAIELCREAAGNAANVGRTKVEIADINGCLEQFGKRRIGDTVAEYSPQCPQIAELIAAFSQQSEEYATDELLKTVSNRVLTSVTPNIVGVLGQPRAIDVAAFLFQIGFLTARRQLEDGYEHITYVDQPGLLRDRTNIDDGVRWEIHPVFRQALQLRDSTGRRTRNPTRDRRGR
jgi:hypothetical protein